MLLYILLSKIKHVYSSWIHNGVNLDGIMVSEVARSSIPNNKRSILFPVEKMMENKVLFPVCAALCACVCVCVRVQKNKMRKHGTEQWKHIQSFG